MNVDRRRRISLGKMAKHRLYRAEVQDGGVIVLEPVIILSVSEWEEYQEDRRIKDVMLASARHEIWEQQKEIKKLREKVAE